jgi:hypothetical protein
MPSGLPQRLSDWPSWPGRRPPTITSLVPTDPGGWSSSQFRTVKSCAGSKAIIFEGCPSTNTGTMRCGATRATRRWRLAASPDRQPMSDRSAAPSETGGDIDERTARYRDKVGAHPRERRSHPCSQCPTGDEAGKPDADPESYCKNQKDLPAAVVGRRSAPPTLLRANSAPLARSPPPTACRSAYASCVRARLG